MVWTATWTGRSTRQPAGRPAPQVIKSSGSIEPIRRSTRYQSIKCSRDVRICASTSISRKTECSYRSRVSCADSFPPKCRRIRRKNYVSACGMGWSMLLIRREMAMCNLRLASRVYPTGICWLFSLSILIWSAQAVLAMWVVNLRFFGVHRTKSGENAES